MELDHLAEAVLAIDAYLTELKARVVQYGRFDQLSKRGYVNPNEELALRQ